MGKNDAVVQGAAKRASRVAAIFGLLGALVALPIVAFAWYVACLLIDLAAGGTLGGYGAGATPGDAWWGDFAYLFTTAVFAVVDVLVGYTIYRFVRGRQHP